MVSQSLIYSFSKKAISKKVLRDGLTFFITNYLWKSVNGRVNFRGFGFWTVGKYRPYLAISILFRPFFFASYMARSARWTSFSPASTWGLGTSATPMLTV